MTAPRIPPLQPDEYDDEVRELLGAVDLTAAGEPRGRGVLNIFATLVRHRGLYRRWLPFGGKLLAGRIPPRLRELAILRTAWLCRAEYEWGQHVAIAKRAGVTDDEIARVREAATGTGQWEPIEQAVLTAVDELHADSMISDATWSRLAAEWDERQLIELPMLVGQYHLVAFTLNSLGVEREPGVPGF